MTKLGPALAGHTAKLTQFLGGRWAAAVAAEELVDRRRAEVDRRPKRIEEPPQAQERAR